MATTRTMRIYGYGYGNSTASIQASLNGTTVFSGEIPTLDQETVFIRPDQQTVIFTVPIPMEFTGNANVAITVANGYVHYDYVDINYNLIPNPAYTTEQVAILTQPHGPGVRDQKIAVYSSVAVPPFSTEELAILENLDPAVQPAQEAIIVAHGAQIASSSGPDGFAPTGPTGEGGDNRPVVYIDGVEQQIPQPRLYPGTYSWGIDAGSTLWGNIIVSPAGFE